MPCRWNTDSARAASPSSSYRRRSDTASWRRARKLSSLSRCWNSAASRLIPELFRICTKNASGIAGITNPATAPRSSTRRHGHAACDSSSIPSSERQRLQVRGHRFQHGTSSARATSGLYCLNTSDDAYCIRSPGAANTTPCPPDPSRVKGPDAPGQDEPTPNQSPLIA